MLLSLLLQIATLLPPSPTWNTEAKVDYLQAVQQLARMELWKEEATDSLHAMTLDQQAGLRLLLQSGTDAEVRLSTILAAGCSGDSTLGYSLWRRAGMEQDETRTIACLLAPKTVPPDVLPMLAWIAADPQRSLPQRATALARLLDADQFATWPMVRSILRTGTAADVMAPGADWKRDGRYELPKRILLLSIQHLLQRHGFDETSFEPNSAWPKQLSQLADLENSMQSMASAKRSVASNSAATWQRLQDLQAEGNKIASLAMSFLD